jgi:CubicO group peptidase (beta-lactamase class C family)
MTTSGRIPRFKSLWSARFVRAAIFVVSVLALVLSPGRSQEPKKTVLPPAAPAAVATASSGAAGTAAHELTATDLEVFLDGLMPAQLERENIAGAVVAVVKDGQVLFAKGYGYSDMEKRVPVTPDATLFRPGSISKLFTWTSVMQLVEQGKLDLDKDVNEYIDFQIPPAFGKPVTLRDIMTHTGGFEETARDLFVADAKHLTPLDQYLKQHLPKRIFPPFVIPAYSNYATSLAGYIVQRVSGKPFEQYVADNIYAPLEMKRTTFVQPLPDDLKPLMSLGYHKASEKPKPFEFVEAFPAGSVATTGRDMCNFMIAHLQDGKFGDKQILRPETAKLMHARAFGSDDRMNGMALGFYEESRNGQRIIGHAGDTELFHSDLHLILQPNVGLFVSYNSAGRGEVSARTILFDKFLDRYFPYTPARPGKIENAKEHAASVAGMYKSSRRFESSFLKLLTFAGQSKAIPNADGTLSVDPLKAPNGELLKFEEIEPFLYREVHGQGKVAFKKDSDGNWQFQMDYPFFVFQKVGLFKNKYFNYALLIFGLGVTLLTVLLWPVGALLRKHYERPLDLTVPEKRGRLTSRFVCLLFVALFLGWVSVLSMANDINAINSLPKWVIIFGIFGVVCSIGTIFVIVNALRTWRSGRWIWAKLHEWLVALACVGLVCFLLNWKLMNFNVHF